jgi:hypothetical protein
MASSCAASSAARVGSSVLQAFDAQRHVGQPARGVDARSERKTEVETRGARRFAPRHGEQRGHARLHAPLADALEALRHQPAVVGVELDHVGHGAQRDQVEQRVQPWLGGGVEAPAPTQFGARGQQHVEHHADTGQRLAGERRSRAGWG